MPTPKDSPNWLWIWLQRSLLLLPLWPLPGTLGLAIVALRQLWLDRQQLQGDRIVWGFGLLSVLAIASCIGAPYPMDAWLGLANFLPFFAVTLGWRALLTTPARLRRVAELWVAAAVGVALLGLGQMLAGWQTPASGPLPAILGWSLQPGGNPPGRLASTFLYANTSGAFLGLAWILGLGVTIAAWQQWWRQRDRWQPLVAWSAGMAIIGAALMLTSSRSGWAIALLAILAYALYLGWYWLLGLAGAVVGAVLWAAFGVPPTQTWLQHVVPQAIWARLNDSLYPDRPVELARLTQWQFCWDLTLTRPWLGWGLRNFTPLYGETYAGVWLGHPHNLYLMLLAEWGLPATVLLSGLVALPLVRAIGWLAQSEVLPSDRLTVLSFLLAFGGCMALNCLDVTLFELRNNILGWLLLAALAGVATNKSQQATTRT